MSTNEQIPNAAAPMEQFQTSVQPPAAETTNQEQAATGPGAGAEAQAQAQAVRSQSHTQAQAHTHQGQEQIAEGVRQAEEAACGGAACRGN
ncbi:hypothetical protein IAT40_006906 [Kwoniella sp. CBS 6097]